MTIPELLVTKLLVTNSSFLKEKSYASSYKLGNRSNFSKFVFQMSGALHRNLQETTVASHFPIILRTD